MDANLFALIRERLSTSTISDTMLKLGMAPHYLPAGIRPLRPDCKLVGRAMPVAMQKGPAASFGKMLDALESLQAGEVYICAAPAGEFALWGELMSLRAKCKGAAGAVVSGFHRDSTGCNAADLALFSAGSYGLSSVNDIHVAAFRCDVAFANGVIVRPADIVVGDDDGVVIVPAEHATKIVEKGIEKADQDAAAAQRVRNGRHIS